MSSSAISAQTGPAAVTAGFLNTDWSPRDVPEGTVTRNVVLRTADNAAVTGSLYLRGKPDTVVCVMHPREFMACHYLIPDIVESGCAAWSQGSRSVGNDLRLEHELALFDVAAGLNFLRGQGFKKIVLLGNSGGASLYAFYVQQSALEGGRRLVRTPGGRPTKLDTLTMPEIDGFVFVAPHPGQGLLLMGCIDPSVTDERDPLSVDSSLDALDPKNGFSEPPAPSKYSAEFLERYRAGQRVRVAKLDAIAKNMIATRMDARKKTPYSRAVKLNLFLFALIGVVFLSGCASRKKKGGDAPREQMIRVSPTPKPSATPRTSKTSDPLFGPTLISDDPAKKP